MDCNLLLLLLLGHFHQCKCEGDITSFNVSIKYIVKAMRIAAAYHEHGPRPSEDATAYTSGQCREGACPPSDPGPRRAGHACR